MVIKGDFPRPVPSRARGDLMSPRDWGLQALDALSIGAGPVAPSERSPDLPSHGNRVPFTATILVGLALHSPL